MTRIKISHEHPPVLGDGRYWKDIPYVSDSDFTIKLTNWIATFITAKRAMHLVMTADGYQEILNYIHGAPVNLALPGPGGRVWRVYVDFRWGMTHDDHWWVQGIGLTIHDSADNIAEFKQQAEVQRLRDQAEERVLFAGPPPRKAYFPIERYGAGFKGDKENGKKHFEELVDQVTRVVIPLASMPTNPIGPDPNNPRSILISTLTLGVGAATGQIISAMKTLGVEAAEALEAAKQTVDAEEAVIAGAREHRLLEPIVDLISIGLEVADMVGPFGPLVTALVGGFIEIAIANQAGPVSRVRSHMYACFVGGVVEELVMSTRVKVRRKGDIVLFDYGKKCVRRLGGPQRYNLQLALMTYAFGQPIGEWSLHPMFEDKPKFPDDYIRYWSPDILERALMTRLCQPDYLYRNLEGSE